MTTQGALPLFPGAPSPPGFSRTVLGRRHALLDPASHVRGGLPGFPAAAAVVLISPQMGAQFAQYRIDLEAGAVGRSEETALESFFYLLDGEAVAESRGLSLSLAPGGFFFSPPGMRWTLGAGRAGARGVLFQKVYAALPGTPIPPSVAGRAQEVESIPFLGDPEALLQAFLPEDPSFDMAVNLFSFRPGAALPFVETHEMEHGLLMFEGRGIYRLEDSWYPVCAGDAIWMAPYCPQWFAALGPTPARYLYYKNMARHPLAG